MTDDGIEVKLTLHVPSEPESVGSVSFAPSPEVLAAIEKAITDAERYGGTPDFVWHDGVMYRLRESKP